MSKLEEIINGWGNYIFKNKEVEELAKKRLSICLDNQGKNDKCMSDRNFCNNCGCFIPAKVRSETSQCPKRKW